MYVASLLKKCIVVFLSVTTVTSSVFLTSYFVKNDKPVVLSSDSLEDSKIEESSILEKQITEENEQVNSEDIPKNTEQQKENNKKENTSESISQPRILEASSSQSNKVQTKEENSNTRPTQLPSTPFLPVKLPIPAELNLDSFNVEDLVQTKDFLNILIEFVAKELISSD